MNLLEVRSFTEKELSVSVQTTLRVWCFHSQRGTWMFRPVCTLNTLLCDHCSAVQAPALMLGSTAQTAPIIGTREK